MRTILSFYEKAHSKMPHSQPTKSPSEHDLHAPAPVQEGQERAALLALAAVAPSIRLAAGMVITAVVIAALYLGRDLLIPLALAVLLGFLLDPLVRRLKRWGLPRMAAILLVVSVALGVLAGIGTYLGGQLVTLAESLPQYQQTMENKLNTLRQSIHGPSVFDGLTNTFKHLRNEIASDLEAPATRSEPSASTPNAPAIHQVQLAPAESSPMEQAQLWLGHIGNVLFTFGIVLLFVVLVLLDRDGLRERLLRLAGGNIHLATDALDEASQRIGKYLRMQLIVNVTYGVPLAAGLWLIGVPGAVLWGAVAALMRYVPYVGPALAAVFPLALAFAVGDGWNMLLWTLALIIALELISNNIIEPWLYGESTGLSTLAIIISATFWTALWGPIGLILATPLSVCLLVLGRSIASLSFLEVLLGSDPVLTPPQRLYQRLLVEDVDSAMDLTREIIRQQMPDAQDEDSAPSGVTHAYDALVLPALRLSSLAHTNIATAEQRFRFHSGMDEFLAEMAQAYPPEPACVPPGQPARVHCLGIRWEVDAIAATAMAHSLQLFGHHASYSEDTLGARINLHALPDLAHTEVLCLAVFSTTPQAQIRYIARHVRKRWPHLRIVAGVWNAPGVELTPDLGKRLMVDHLVGRLHEMVMRVGHLLNKEEQMDYQSAALPDNEAQRLQALHESGLLEPLALELYQDAVRRALNAFDMKHAQIALVDEQWVHTPATSLFVPQENANLSGLPRTQSMSAYVVSQAAPLIVEDTQGDVRFTRNPHVLGYGIRFFAGAPLLDKRGNVLGALCVMDDDPHPAEDVDMELLQYMASELMADLQKHLRASKKTGNGNGNAISTEANTNNSGSVQAPAQDLDK